VAERRYNALTGDWVILSPERANRPWQGSREHAAAPFVSRWERECYLCPRNARANGTVNPNYRGTYVFDNDFPALDVASDVIPQRDPLLHAETISGRCRVLCYSERHDATLASLSIPELAGVVDAWRDVAIDLGTAYPWVQIFENKGAAMGCSSPHPHGQAWATSVVPVLARREDQHQREHAESHGSTLLLDYAERELALGDRVVVRNERWMVVVPYWAAWPFETLLLPRQHRPDFDALDSHDITTLSEILSQLLPAYDRLFDVSFPYSMGWHGRGRDLGPYWQLHAHFYPPLLRSASVRKFMVGFEMLAEAQRDLTPEAAADRLRRLVR
jgi:UDPglucose--hexose-1-phosphate uridylyltransferase